ncbi:HD domain-containing protein [Glycomyces salinus]|uniref:HD domain-containing protein n=1 Tax=Glycomyces salinus TaxID=980294 RepID=UPI0018EC22BF|nr:HD domain-containing protein [Glycomyces salinus]
MQSALDHASSELAADATGHDIHHVMRVFRMARRLARAEAANLEDVELIAALHDVADFKFTGDEHSGSRTARTWLLAQGVDTDRADRLAGDIAGLSFKGAETPTTPLTLEGMCVQDADRLDALGAVGIARCFTYGGHKGRAMHDPSVPVQLHATTKQYLNHRGTSINHFYEKLLLLKERLNTESARDIAEKRHVFMEMYLEQFYAEWESSAQRSTNDGAPQPSLSYPDLAP